MTAIARTRMPGWLLLALAVLLTGLATTAATAATSPPGTAPAVTFEQPTATGSLGAPLVFTTTLHADEPPRRVELLTQVAGQAGYLVRSAAVSPRAGEGYEASLGEVGHILPNTTIRYRFRAVLADGMVEGPETAFTVPDDRFTWRVLGGTTVTLHWYEGDDAFARRALDIGEQAIEQAATLLGVATVRPVDFFIYASETPFRDALGPGTRENVGGQANSAIRTLFGLIEPSEISSDWVHTLVTHELTHLVFADAVDNPYHLPPRWLNEGLAVYLSQGYVDSDRAAVADAARSGELIPLEGLAGLFPTTRERFSLAYSESASAVDFFVATHGQDTLVRLITSYATGVTDDEAFRASTGGGVAAFDDAWIAAQGGTRPEPFGPQPAPGGPLPSGWTDEPAPASSAP